MTLGAAIMRRNRLLVYSVTVALGFLWTGASYISHMYRLHTFFPSGQVDIIALRWNYLAQAVGLILYAFLLGRFPAIVSRRVFFVLVMLLDASFMTLALLSGHPLLSLWAGLVMNLLHGTVAAAYLTLLGAFLPLAQRGRAFGYAYAAGSLSTYLLSLVAGGRMIRSSYAVAVYLAFVGANSLVVCFGEDLPDEETKGTDCKGSVRNKVVLLFPTLVLMAVLSSVGSQYQFQVVADQKVSLELSRAFYAIGLTAAGIATDKNRKLGAILCYVSLVFPFAQVVLRTQPPLIAFAWGLSYLLLGFYSVFRAITFVDISGQSPRLLPLAALGLAAGRVGEALGTLLPETVLGHQLYVTLLVLALFVPLTLLFFFFLQAMYGQEPSLPGDPEAIFHHFETEYALTRREGEVLRHILAGRANGEIAAALFVSESTVKFHVKNILRKTGCSNRIEIVALVRGSGASG